MTLQIALVLSILGAAVVFLVTEWVAMEVTALLVLGATALTGLLSPEEALSGFSNPAVVTVWAVFILSGALTRTGVGNLIGRRVLRLAGRREPVIVTVVMVSAAVMSAFMNNVAVAALLLPVVMDIARHTALPPSRLLLPLAYGSLLGGLTTLIGTPPNILASEALRDAGLRPFGLFDYTPVGLAVMASGVAFMALVGRRLLPVRNVAEESSAAGSNLGEQYELGARIFLMRLPRGSELEGKTLAASRIGSALGLNVVGVTRRGQTQLAPGPSFVLQAGDHLLVEGRLDRLEELSHWGHLAVEEGKGELRHLFERDLVVAEATVAAGSLYVGKTLNEIGFRDRFGVNVLAILRRGVPHRTNLQDEPLEGADTLLILGTGDRMAALKEISDLGRLRTVSEADLIEAYHLQERFLIMGVPHDSFLNGKTLKESRLGDALGMRVLGILRENGTLMMPEPEERLSAEDRLMVEGKREDLAVLQGLEGLEIERHVQPDPWALETEQIGMVEAVLSPRTTLEGKTLRQLHFREKFGLSVLAIWRKGRVHRSELRDMALRFGDAMLLHGPREKLRVLGREPDFLVLTQAAQEVPRTEKAAVSICVMTGVLLPVLMGLVPIYIAAVVGAALMLLTRCLTVEEAYRCIEWRAVFLIAGMLPLGTALDKTGAARFLAEKVVATAGPFGPTAILLGLLTLTFLATCFIPTAALVVLLAPIALSTAAETGMSPHALMMALAMAASASFMTPISHPANIMVMGPGGYRFLDYVKVGLPLTLVVLSAVLLALPRFWPLFP